MALGTDGITVARSCGWSLLGQGTVTVSLLLVALCTYCCFGEEALDSVAGGNFLPGHGNMVWFAGWPPGQDIADYTLDVEL